MLNQFLQDEDGAQIIEYALIIAVISIAMVVALQPIFTTGTFTTFIGRLTACLTTATCA
ncbi:Flp family type IVb pilin [Janthinobacterium sp. 17J80-10]|uniref:Flp family type IVb pilin n=1 Tax=Janthinobacterium sp. 17J80-10 TaxID=2497863 RepID=UPI00100571C9|nr:Flp family type IVb pilin [Janthinobacterium sp. 17J80-10]QAU33455.1 Flp family type IVb pilin [Janthinobacterium sp. 17J80-10]